LIIFLIQFLFHSISWTNYFVLNHFKRSDENRRPTLNIIGRGLQFFQVKISTKSFWKIANITEVDFTNIYCEGGELFQNGKHYFLHICQNINLGNCCLKMLIKSLEIIIHQTPFQTVNFHQKYLFNPSSIP